MTARPWWFYRELLAQAGSWHEYRMMLHYLRASHWDAMKRSTNTFKPPAMQVPGYPSFSSNPNDYSQWHFRQWQICNNLIEGVAWP